MRIFRKGSKKEEQQQLLSTSPQANRNRSGSKSPRNNKEEQQLLSTSPKESLKSPRSPRGLFNPTPSSPRSYSNSDTTIVVNRIKYTSEELEELEKFFFSEHNIEKEPLPEEFNHNKNFQKLIRQESGKPVHERYNSMETEAKLTTSDQAFINKMFEYCVQNMRMEYLICCLANYEILTRITAMKEEDIKSIYPLVQFMTKNFFAVTANYGINFGDANKSFNDLTTQQIRQGWLEAVEQEYTKQDLLLLLQATKKLLHSLFHNYFSVTTESIPVTLSQSSLTEQHKLIKAFSAPIKLNPEDKYELGLNFICVGFYELDARSICYQNYNQNEISTHASTTTSKELSY